MKRKIVVVALLSLVLTAACGDNGATEASQDAEIDANEADTGIEHDTGSDEDAGSESTPGPRLLLYIGKFGSFGGFFAPDIATAVGTFHDRPGPCRFRMLMPFPASHAGGPGPLVLKSESGEASAPWNDDVRFRSFRGNGPDFSGEVSIVSAPLDGEIYTSNDLGAPNDEELTFIDDPYDTLRRDVPHVKWDASSAGPWDHVVLRTLVYDSGGYIIGVTVCVAGIEEERVALDLSIMPENARYYNLNGIVIDQREATLQPAGTVSVSFQYTPIVELYRL